MVAASKPTSSLFKQHHILSTKHRLGALVDSLGCFPLGNEAYPPLPDCPDSATRHSEFDWVQHPGKGPSPFSALPPRASVQTLYLNIFRGEPAMTGFV
jgi:hypothetical protein